MKNNFSMQSVITLFLSKKNCWESILDCVPIYISGLFSVQSGFCVRARKCFENSEWLLIQDTSGGFVFGFCYCIKANNS